MPFPFPYAFSPFLPFSTPCLYRKYGARHLPSSSSTNNHRTSAKEKAQAPGLGLGQGLGPGIGLGQGVEQGAGPGFGLGLAQVQGLGPPDEEPPPQREIRQGLDPGPGLGPGLGSGLGTTFLMPSPGPVPSRRLGGAGTGSTPPARSCHVRPEPYDPTKETYNIGSNH